MAEKKIRKSSKTRTDWTKTRIGKPPTCSDEVLAKITSVIKTGAYIETAIAFAGVPKATFYDWIKYGRQGIEPYKKVFELIEKTVAEAEIRDLLFIDAAAKTGHWQAAAWRLERRNPNRWGRQIRHEVSGIDGGAIAVKEVTLEEATKRATQILQKLTLLTDDDIEI